MKNLIRLKESRAVRPIRLAASAVAVAAAVGAAGILAGPGNATPPVRANYGAYPPTAAKFKAPKLKQGTLTVKGTKRSDKITLRLQAGEPGVLQVDVGDDGSADFSFERSKITNIVVRARAGNDLVRIDESNGFFTDSIPTTLDGGPGSDTLIGGKGNETLLGGPGNDTIDGNGGNDVAFVGAGDDTFVWDPGDGSKVNIDLAGALGGATGDGKADRVIVNATNGNDTIDVSGDAGTVKVSGLAAAIQILHSQVADDRLEINTLAGTDTVTSAGLAAGAIQLLVDGLLVP